MGNEFEQAMNAERKLAHDGVKRDCGCSEKPATGGAIGILGVQRPTVEDMLPPIKSETNRLIIDGCNDGANVIIAERDVSSGATVVYISNNVGETIGLPFYPGEYKMLGQLALFLRQTSQQMAAMQALGDAENDLAKLRTESRRCVDSMCFAAKRVEDLKKVAGL